MQEGLQATINQKIEVKAHLDSEVLSSSVESLTWQVILGS